MGFIEFVREFFITMLWIVGGLLIMIFGIGLMMGGSDKIGIVTTFLGMLIFLYGAKVRKRYVERDYIGR